MDLLCVLTGSLPYETSGMFDAIPTIPSSGQATTDTLLALYTPCLPLRGSVELDDSGLSHC